MINVGSMIGSGIFIVPAMIALQLDSTPMVVLVWVLDIVLAISTVMESPRDTVIGCAMILSGIPAYWWWNRKKD